MPEPAKMNEIHTLPFVSGSHREIEWINLFVIVVIAFLRGFQILLQIILNKITLNENNLQLLLFLPSEMKIGLPQRGGCAGLKVLPRKGKTSWLPWIGSIIYRLAC